MSFQSKEWILTNSTGIDDLQTLTVSTPPLGSFDVLVEMKALSLKQRDIVLVLGLHPLPRLPNIVPGSDAAGSVIAVGASVTAFRKGDRVATTFFQDYVAGPLTVPAAQSALGSLKDDTFRQCGVFPESGLVHVPESLLWQEAAALSCVVTTAWNALFGETGTERPRMVLVQGTGGVSLFALQSCWARVIAITSSEEKVELLKSLGAKHVINCTTHPEWGQMAKELSGNGDGIDNVLDVVGGKTLLHLLGI